MPILVAGALFALASVPPPRPPPPFSEKAATVATFEAEHVSYEFQRCHLATTNSNGRYVEAMGTARFSPEWKKATLAMENALNVCQDLRQALRNEKESLLRIIQSGAKQDVDAARARLDSVAFELDGIEKYFSTETIKYRDLVALGWGNPHCVDPALGSISPPKSLCPFGESSQ